jgi:hypothetical protein
MNKQFTRMQKLAGIITEGLYTTQMDQEAPIQSEATPNKMKKSELKAKIKEMIQGEGSSDNLEEYDSQGLTNAASVIDYYLNMAYDAGERGVVFDDSLAYKALEHLKEFSDEFTDSTLYEAKKKEEDTEEEVDVEAPVAPEGEMDVTMDAPTGDDTTVDINGDGTGDIDAGSSEAKKAFGDLTDAFQAAKTLGDEKLIRQIANTITYFNKNIILKQG